MSAANRLRGEGEAVLKIACSVKIDEHGLAELETAASSCFCCVEMSPHGISLSFSTEGSFSGLLYVRDVGREMSASCFRCNKGQSFHDPALDPVG
jgi:hypothetical protein